MIELFKKHLELKILSFFLANPNSSFHVKELARKLEISAGSASKLLKTLEENELLVKEEKGLAHFYSLNSENKIIEPLKKAFGIAFVLSSKPMETLLKADKNIISFALFGSYANGHFDEKSDIDFLIITPTKKEKLVEAIKKLERFLGKKISLSPFKLSEWRAMARKNDVFYKRIVENNVLLFGSGLK